MSAVSQPYSIELSRQITRADGTVEPEEVVATTDPDGPGHIEVHERPSLLRRLRNRLGGR